VVQEQQVEQVYVLVELHPQIVLQQKNLQRLQQ
jgi:hypothetical protein